MQQFANIFADGAPNLTFLRRGGGGGAQFGVGGGYRDAAGVGGVAGGGSLEDRWREAGAFFPPEPRKTRKMFSRNCELEVQGVEDSSESEEESEVEVEVEVVVGGSGEVGEDAKGGGTRSSSKRSSSPTREEKGKGKAKEVPPPPPDSDDDDLAIINEDGTETKINAAYFPKLNPSSTSSSSSSSKRPHSTSTLGTSLPLLKKRKRKTNLDPHLTFGCSSCLRPLLLDASTRSRRIWSLACGHLVDGWCLSGL